MGQLLHLRQERRVAVVGQQAEHESAHRRVILVIGVDPARVDLRFLGRLLHVDRNALAECRQRLEEILGRPVDVVTEPVRKDRLRKSIERERAFAF